MLAPIAFALMGSIHAASAAQLGISPRDDVPSEGYYNPNDNGGAMLTVRASPTRSVDHWLTYPNSKSTGRTPKAWGSRST